MATMKCVHKGCGKSFTDENEECVYHPGPPDFHEGLKGSYTLRNFSCQQLKFSRMEVLQTSGHDL